MTGERRTDVEVWLAFERLDHAYLVRDDDAVSRELALIDRLRDEAAEAAREALAGPARSSALAEVIARLGVAVDLLLQLPLVPALVRGEATGTAVRQADAVIGDDERQALGTGVEVSAVYNGEDLGVDLLGLDAHVEGRIHLFVEEAGDVIQLPVVEAAAGFGLLSATVPWTAGLPEHLIVVVEAT